MIRPQKHLNLNVCVLRISACALAHLRQARVENFNSLLGTVKMTIGEDAEVLFLPAMNLLFLLGRLAYYPHTDTFEYVEVDKASPDRAS
jgi:hypothetical protein